MKNFILLVLGLTILGCGQPKQIVNNPSKSSNTVVSQPVKSDSGLSIGPKLKIGPSFNISKGRFEIGPSFHFGPRLNF